MNIDWSELRAQKRILNYMATMQVFNQETKQKIEGVIQLLDAIQDCAVDTKEATEHEVFGDMT